MAMSTADRYAKVLDFVRQKRILWINGVPFAITSMEADQRPMMFESGERERIEIKAMAIRIVDGVVPTSAERERIAAWHEDGEPVPVAFEGTHADYIRAGLPGWEV